MLEMDWQMWWEVKSLSMFVDFWQAYWKRREGLIVLVKDWHPRWGSVESLAKLVDDEYLQFQYEEVCRAGKASAYTDHVRSWRSRIRNHFSLNGLTF